MLGWIRKFEEKKKTSGFGESTVVLVLAYLDLIYNGILSTAINTRV